MKKNGNLTTEYAVIFAVFAVVAITASLQIIKPTFNKFYNGVGNIIDGTTGQMQGYSSTAEGDGGSGGGGGSSGEGGSGGGGGSSGEGGSGGGSSGGDSGGSSGGGTGEGGGGTGEDSGGTGEGGDKSSPVVGSSLDQALEALKAYETGLEYYDLIESKNISIIYEDMSDAWAGYWSAIDNKIAINASLSESSSGFLATIIAHESTHADYTYSPQKWIDSTLERHPELTMSDLHITTYPHYSLDQEYMAFYETARAWEVLRGAGGETSVGFDYTVSLIAAGEDVTKAYLRSIPDYADLPDY